MATSSSSRRTRGAAEPDARSARIRRRWMTALVGTGLVGGALAIALAVKDETCTVEGRIPQDAAIICAMQRGEQDPCPAPDVMSREECERILGSFDENHGRG